MLAIEYKGTALLLPTREVIKEIQEMGFPWFTGVEWKCRHGMANPSSGVFLATGTQLTAITSSCGSGTLKLKDTSTGGLVEFEDVGITRYSLALPGNSSSTTVWFVWLADQRDTGTVYAQKYWNETFAGIDELVSGAGTTAQAIFAVLLGDYGWTDSWDAPAPPAGMLPYNLVVTQGTQPYAIDRLLADYCCTAVWAFTGSTVHAVEPGNDIAGATQPLEDYFTDYNNALLLMDGRWTNSNTCRVPKYLIGSWVWTEASIPYPYWKRAHYTGRPVSYNNDFWLYLNLPWLAHGNPADLAGTPSNSLSLASYGNYFSTNFYERFSLDPYSLVFSGWVTFEASAKWEELTYEMRVTGATTRISYNQFLPFNAEALPQFAYSSRGTNRMLLHQHQHVDFRGPEQVWAECQDSVWDIGGFFNGLICDASGANVSTYEVKVYFKDLPGRSPNVHLGDIVKITFDPIEGVWFADDAHDDAIGTIKWVRGTNEYGILDGSCGWQIANGSTVWSGTPQEVTTHDLRGKDIIGYWDGGDGDGHYDYTGNPVTQPLIAESPGYKWHGYTHNGHPDHLDHIHEILSCGAPIIDYAYETVDNNLDGSTVDVRTAVSIDLNLKSWVSTEYYDDPLLGPTITDLEHGAENPGFNGPTPLGKHDEQDTDNRHPYFVEIPIERVP
jgi:hypothetical protein